ncbi:MAG TPA: hypothetical protein VGR77_05515 [Candidatus Dormibacteraeota bacterium]|nr:hypothetical protein [Candidatus Dormibacteraeota bacterium]
MRVIRSDAQPAAVRQRLLLAGLVALASAALAAVAALGIVLTLHFVAPDLIGDLPAGVGLLLSALLPLTAGVVLANSRRKDSSTQRSRLMLARSLLASAIIAIIVAGFITAFAVGFTLADSPPFDRRGLDFTLAVTSGGFYAALATDALALVMTLLIRVPRSGTSADDPDQQARGRLDGLG